MWVGKFTIANGKTRSRIAAYDLATGQLVSSFRPLAATTVRAITATNTTVYFGGDFRAVDGITRSYVAAADAATGAVLPFWADVDAPVTAMTLTGDRSKLVIGGRFTNVNWSTAYGMAALNPSTGDSLPWAANQVVQNGGTGAAITSLTADATSVYGTGYAGRGTALSSRWIEGSFRANASTGALVWLEDCHGDSYSIFPTAEVAYVAGHPHDCSTVGGYSDPTFTAGPAQRAVAFTNMATGVIQNNQAAMQWGYPGFAGQPAPTLLTWFPKLWPGTYTGQGQAAWSVAGNAQYVVFGGEFKYVNATGQQGLVRFAVASLAPNKAAPISSAGLTPTAKQRLNGKVALHWGTTSDRDNQYLTYRVYRNYAGPNDQPICSVTNQAAFWDLQQLSCIDTSAPRGQNVRYRVIASDPYGNVVSGDDRAIWTQ